MEKLGYGPNNKLKVKVATRDFNTFRDPAVILVDQLKQIHFDAELDVVDLHSGTIAFSRGITRSRLISPAPELMILTKS